ncbi:MAG: hypothetical protein EAZ07_07515 [Cytophagales bacterium]|nr:MAG: hypothetical protein EAZ07_07515 [Cytophagales bacterium]
MIIKQLNIFLTFLLSFFLLSFSKLEAQELFPYAESANPQLQKAFSYRINAEYYNDLQQNYKNWLGISGIYGITKNLTSIITLSGSNHHIKSFPKGFATYFLNHHTQYNSKYPFQFEGIHGMLKYRILKWDGFRRHLRLALYAEKSWNNVAHDEAEPNLKGDNAGWGTGAISTILWHRFATSITAGFVNPKSYYDKKSDVTIRSGDMYLVNLSFGYLLFPKRYESYDDLNINIYAEFAYRNYQKVSLSQGANVFDLTNYTFGDPFTFNSLQARQYCDLRTSIQFIFNSKSRIDIGVAWKLWKQSYVHQYPMLNIGYQKNIFK